ncbi:MAG: Cell division protein ZapE, partial [Pseudomonadota bacterium]|nr:Cell division protein ZapE [Pseudomonadota bacterium]
MNFVNAPPSQINMTPGHYYRMYFSQSGITPDAAQTAAAAQLADLHQRLVQDITQLQTIRGKVADWFQTKRLPVTGIYMWGGIGR